mgnify:FL=1
MALLKEESYTIEDIYALPDGERAELIDGHIYYMAPPSYKHQKLVMELSAIIRNYIKQHKGTCEVLPAPFAVYLDEINNTFFFFILYSYFLVTNLYESWHISSIVLVATNPSSFFAFVGSE